MLKKVQPQGISKRPRSRSGDYGAQAVKLFGDFQKKSQAAYNAADELFQHHVGK